MNDSLKTYDDRCVCHHNFMRFVHFLSYCYLSVLISSLSLSISFYQLILITNTTLPIIIRYLVIVEYEGDGDGCDRSKHGRQEAGKEDFDWVETEKKPLYHQKEGPEKMISYHCCK